MSNRIEAKATKTGLSLKVVGAWATGTFLLALLLIVWTFYHQIAGAIVWIVVAVTGAVVFAIGCGGLWLVGRGAREIVGAVVSYQDAKVKRLTSSVVTVPRTHRAYLPAAGGGLQLLADAWQPGDDVIDGQAQALPDVDRRGLLSVLDDELHIAVVGATRSGKTTALLHILSHLKNNHPDANFFALDPHLNDTPWPDYVRGFWQYHRIFSRIDWAFDELEKRRGPNENAPYRPVFLLMDEIPGIMDEANVGKMETERQFKRLAREGWKFGFRLVISTQSTLVQDTYINTNTQSNFVWIQLSQEMKRQNAAQILDRNLKPCEVVTLPGLYQSATMPAAMSEADRIRAEFAPDKSLRAICRDAGLPQNGASGERVKAAMRPLGWQYDDEVWSRTE